MGQFVSRLSEKQGDMTGAAFARKLGISRSVWSLIKQGHRSPSREVQEKALALFPDLSESLVEDARAKHGAEQPSEPATGPGA